MFIHQVDPLAPKGGRETPEKVFHSRRKWLLATGGGAMVKAAYSTNIKERRDSSTCLFDAKGRTLCQASHIPMHLGSLIGIIDAIHARVDPAGIAEGDVFIGNEDATHWRQSRTRWPSA